MAQALAALSPTDPEFVTRSLYKIGMDGATEHERLADFLTTLHHVPSDAWQGEDPIIPIMKGVIIWRYRCNWPHFSGVTWHRGKPDTAASGLLWPRL
ncbi:hypothetical protein [Streptomyces sp. NPDC093094]|uniref:hypothetical protein n=1 Tax=Streptomyces sp. NPDC093094 TaxID=3366026 RepID=UPI0038109FA4